MISPNASIQKVSVDRAVHHLTKVLFREILFESDKEDRYWPKADRRFRRYNLFWTERKVLSALLDSEPLNNYRLALKSRLHYTQIRRAVSSLLRRRAIEPVSRKLWRTRKISTTYRLTPFGRFLNFYHNRSSVADRDLLTCLRELAIHIKSKVLEDLTESVSSISDQKRKRDHLWKLLDIVFEAQENLANPSWRQPTVTEFVSRAWLNQEDIRSYARHLPIDCRTLLVKTKEGLLARVHEIDAVLM